MWCCCVVVFVKSGVVIRLLSWNTKVNSYNIFEHMEQMYPKCMAMILNRFTIVRCFNDVSGREGGKSQWFPMSMLRFIVRIITCHTKITKTRIYFITTVLLNKWRFTCFCYEEREKLTRKTVLFFFRMWMVRMRANWIPNQLHRRKNKHYWKEYLAIRLVMHTKYTKTTRILKQNKANMRNNSEGVDTEKER